MEQDFSIQSKKTITMTLSQAAFKRVFSSITEDRKIGAGSEEFQLFLKIDKQLD